MALSRIELKDLLDEVIFTNGQRKIKASEHNDLVTKLINGLKNLNDDTGPFDNIYFVDINTSYIGTPEVDDPLKPWTSIKAAALAAYTDQQATNNWNQVYVFEGVYNENSIAYPKIEMFFEAWAIVYHATISPINDLNATGRFQIRGLGRFYTELYSPGLDSDAINIRNDISGNGLDIECYEFSSVQLWQNGSKTNEYRFANCRVIFDVNISLNKVLVQFDNVRWLTGWKNTFNNTIGTNEFHRNSLFELPATSEIAGILTIKDKSGTTLFNIDNDSDSNLTTDFASIQEAADVIDNDVVSAAIQLQATTITINHNLTTYRFENCRATVRRENCIAIRWFEQVENQDDVASVTFSGVLCESDGVSNVAGFAFDKISALDEVRPLYISGVNTVNCSQREISRAGTSKILTGDRNKLDKLSPIAQSIFSKVEFLGLAIASTAAGVIKSFTATPEFDFAIGNDHKMTLTGNITDFTTTGEDGSMNGDIWLVNDGTPGRTVATPTGWTEIPGGDTHDDSANAINLYQFKTDPEGTIKKYIIKNMTS